MSNANANANANTNANANLKTSVAAAEAAATGADGGPDEMELPVGPAPAQEIGKDPEDEPATIEDYIREEHPYPEERRARIENFYKKRERKPALFTYSPEGDLVILGKDGDQQDAIALKSYVPYEESEWTKRDERRADVLAMAETRYEAAHDALRKAMEEYKLTGAKQPVMAAQAQMAAADAVLSRVRYGARAIQSLPNPETREVLFEEMYETRRLFGTEDDPFKKTLARLVTREYPFYTFYGSYVELAPAKTEGAATAALDGIPGADEAAVRQRLRDGRMARVFFEADEGANGFLSPFWPTEFTLGDTNYFTAYQAYEAERAKELGKDALRRSILGTRSGRTIRFLTKKITEQPKDPKGLWLRILLSLYQQHPELKERLLATGTDALVFADVLPGPSGVALAPSDKGILDPSRWKGPNAMGVALETIRIQFREGTAKEAPRNETTTEGAITEEQQQAAKVGAIVNTKRKFAVKRA